MKIWANSWYHYCVTLVTAYYQCLRRLGVVMMLKYYPWL